MRMTLLLLVICCATFAENKDEDCVKFHKETPKYLEAETKVIEKYFPQMASIKPLALASHYISEIRKTKGGVVFYFSSLESIKSHECKESGLITMVMDGSFSVKVNEDEKMIEWYPGESAEKPFKVKLK